MDKGVHAMGQVAHFDTNDQTKLSPFNITNALNYHLKPEPIAILKTEIAECFS